MVRLKDAGGERRQLSHIHHDLPSRIQQGLTLRSERSETGLPRIHCDWFARLHRRIGAGDPGAGGELFAVLTTNLLVALFARASA
jgi:hypothetical protein